MILLPKLLPWLCLRTLLSFLLSFFSGVRVNKLPTATKLFTPLKNVTQKVLSSKTGRKVISSVKEQAIDSSINLAKDLASGKNLKQSITDEVENVKDNMKRKAVDIGIDFLKSKKKKPQKTKKKVAQRRKKQKDIFD